MTSEPKRQPQSDEALIAELRAKAHASTRHKTQCRTPAPVREHVCWRAAARLAELQADHAEAFAGKVVLSQAALEELIAEPSEAAVERAAQTYNRTMNPLGSWVSLSRDRRAKMVAAMRAAVDSLTPSESENDG